MAKAGQFASANAPYGYLKAAEDKHKLVVDEEAAAVVREIFRLRLSGLSGNKIASILNERAIPSPAQYALNHKRGMDWRRVNQKTAWDPAKKNQKSLLKVSFLL
ncbi:MAG: recombinase family protein [Lachnospiraceae bacterium]